MNKLSTAKKIQVISALVEGCSVRSTVRMTGVAKGTILRLLTEVGEACAKYQDQTMQNLTCKRLQADEIWSLTPAMEAGVSQHVWSIEEVVALIDHAATLAA